MMLESRVRRKAIEIAATETAFEKDSPHIVYHASIFVNAVQNVKTEGVNPPALTRVLATAVQKFAAR